jgi:hypothetical protein
MPKLTITLEDNEGGVELGTNIEPAITKEQEANPTMAMVMFAQIMTFVQSMLEKPLSEMPTEPPSKEPKS